jgi:hypothetical protein
VSDKEAVSIQRKAKSTPKQRTFTTEDAADTEEGKTLPLIDADERGLGNGGKQVEWKPTPDMYRMEDTREGREAYAASFSDENHAATRGAARAVRRVIAPDDSTQVHNSSLRDERLPKGPRSASGPLDADTGAGSVLQTEPYANLG